jgi:predicted MFS family arabinose efflux permease
MNRKLWYLAAGYALTVAFALSLQFLPPVIPLMKANLGMTVAQAGALMSSLALFGIVVSPLVGFLADRWGGRTVGLLGLGCLAAAECWFALSSSYASLLCARLAMGVGAATLSILGAQIISERFSGTGYLGAAMGTMNTAVPVGILVSQLCFSRLGAARGWQAPVWACLVFTVVIAVLYLFFYRDPAAAVENVHPSLTAGLRHLSPQVWRLGLVWMFWNAGTMILLTFANDLLVSRGMTSQAAGTMAGILMVFPVGASSILGHVADRKHWQSACAAAGCMLYAVLVSLLGTLRGGVVPLFLGISFTFALTPAAVFSLAPYLMRGPESGLGYGVLAGMLNIGTLVGPAVAGAVRDATGGYLASFLIAGILTCIGAACVMLLHKPRTENTR